MLAKRSKSNMPKWYEEKLKNGCPNKTYRESFEQIDIHKHSSREYMKH